ncbi:DASH complex subunit Dad1 [Metschnikowia aff. pulcherrima]|uniref:DASH complex subunit DAD1 n=1 Tax=Metschnikowia aff. pulcherrima TaxID=2163413 RepID=A0A4P6XKJ7_9ASCO|nr:DASH complex subunit Dad1 [Metschnikowia aff. pulcherrima]
MSDTNQDPDAAQSSFEQQRDQLVQEITAAMDSVVFNLDILNRSLKESIEVGNGFQDASRLWSTFYNSGADEAQSRRKPDGETPKKAQNQEGPELDTETVSEVPNLALSENLEVDRRENTPVQLSQTEIAAEPTDIENPTPTEKGTEQQPGQLEEENTQQNVGDSILENVDLTLENASQ